LKKDLRGKLGVEDGLERTPWQVFVFQKGTCVLVIELEKM
jgi:hypothetical protein